MKTSTKIIFVGIAITFLLLVIGRFRSPKQAVDSQPALVASNEVTSPYLSAYSGVYHISPDGAEAFALADNGRASWVYGYPENGKITTVTKYGTWEARENFISISINGNTGLIVENYQLKNGIFRNVDAGTRYLTKRQP